MNNIFQRNCVAAILLKIQAIYSLWLTLKIDKVAITHLAMEIHFQTTDHVVAVEKVAEQHIGTRTNNKRDIGTFKFGHRHLTLNAGRKVKSDHIKRFPACFPIGCFHIPKL